MAQAFHKKPWPPPSLRRWRLDTLRIEHEREANGILEQGNRRLEAEQRGPDQRPSIRPPSIQH